MNNSSGGIGFFGLLQLMLIGLKLTGYIALSWWWVLCPLLLAIIVGCLVFGFAIVVASRRRW